MSRSFGPQFYEVLTRTARIAQRNGYRFPETSVIALAGTLQAFQLTPTYGDLPSDIRDTGNTLLDRNVRRLFEDPSFRSDAETKYRRLLN
ncbi:MAG: hypothetical protein HYY37_06240 [Candidatus Aenigmarchaeota archaeon]|nr:hypothetical protein [Candidatus Aenigmarchaeota archaeon]